MGDEVSDWSKRLTVKEDEGVWGRREMAWTYVETKSILTMHGQGKGATPYRSSPVEVKRGRRMEAGSAGKPR